MADFEFDKHINCFDNPYEVSCCFGRFNCKTFQYLPCWFKRCIVKVFSNLMVPWLCNFVTGGAILYLHGRQVVMKGALLFVIYPNETLYSCLLRWCARILASCGLQAWGDERSQNEKISDREICHSQTCDIYLANSSTMVCLFIHFLFSSIHM